MEDAKITRGHPTTPTSATQTQEEPVNASLWTWMLPLCLVLLTIGMYALWPPFRASMHRAYTLLTGGNQEQLKAWITSFGAWGPITILGLMLLQTLVAFLPSVLIMVVSVLAYGALWGSLLAWGGLLVAALLAYCIGRALGPITISKLIGSKTEHQVATFVDRYGFWGIIAARISPALSTDAVSYAAGLTRMRLASFLVATAAGILPLVALIAFLGEDIDRLKTGLIWISVISLLVFLGYVIYDHRK
jgi:uncharacterized membrane protein YdjX (TVP38/TMEM64 family)